MAAKNVVQRTKQKIPYKKKGGLSMVTPYLEVGRIYEQNLFFVQKVVNF